MLDNEDKELIMKKTGIESFDKLLNGGIPEGHVVLLSGDTGTGKTILTTQWLYTGFSKFKEPGVYITLTEPIYKTKKILRRMSYYCEEDTHELGICLTDLRSIIDQLGIDRKKITKEEIDRIISVIGNIVKTNQSRRLVLDSITVITYLLEKSDLIRYFIFALGNTLTNLNCTTILTSEAPYGKLSLFGIEEFISDGVVLLTHTKAEQEMTRKLLIIKMRGTSYRSGDVVYEITKDGFLIYPKIPVNRILAKTDFNKRMSSGIIVLDEMTEGGYPEGHMILIAGNTGSGKSTFGMHFLKSGLERGEHVLFINLEEPRSQVLKTAESHNWDLQNYFDQEKLHFISPNLIDMYPDKLLYRILNMVQRYNIKRVVLDSVSSILSANMDKDKVREFLLQLSGYFKSQGTTCIMTYLTEEMFGAIQGSLLGVGASSSLRLSSIVDGIILLRYVERKKSIRKLVNVLKLRGSNHEKGIRTFKITKQEGVIIEKKIFSK